MKPGQVHVWIINPSDVVGNDSDAVLSKVELERALKMEDRGARQLFVAGRIVMRTILGMILNLETGVPMMGLVL